MQNKADKLTDNAVFKEVFSTEKNYNSALKFLFLSLGKQLQFKKDPFFRDLHTHIEQFIEVSDKLSINATNSLHNIENLEIRETLKIQRVQLLKCFFTIYKSYEKLVNQYAALSNKDPEYFKRINLYMIKNNSKKLDFAAHIIMPIQRGPRYLLLTKELKKNNQGSDEFNNKEWLELEQLISDSLSEFSNKNSQSSTPQKRPYQCGEGADNLSNVGEEDKRSTLGRDENIVGKNPSSDSKSTSSSNICFQVLCGVSVFLGAVALIIALGVLDVLTAGTATGIALAIGGGIGFFGGSLGLTVSRCKSSDDNQLGVLLH